MFAKASPRERTPRHTANAVPASASASAAKGVVIPIQTGMYDGGMLGHLTGVP